ncbi:MAG: hypothetical protein JO337_02065 [Acidimicrobiales bacterium]|nr:hypothetical protein [Acidimicrobiales bacterium]
MTVTVNPQVTSPARMGRDGLGADQLDDAVLRMFALVRETLGGATEAFLAGDRQAARSLVEQDQVIDALHQKAQKVATRELLKNGEESSRRRLLLILAILPELERSGDLAEHIAAYAVQGLARWLTPKARSLVAQMGSLGSEMWGLAEEAYAARDGGVALMLRMKDDEIDDLHVTLTAELAAARVSVPVAIQMALVARYFERLGDHAVNVTRQLQHAGLGSSNAVRSAT